MSNESSLNEGKSSTNEKNPLVSSSSQPIQAALPPPPPPPDPSSSSSSSSNPPSLPEVSVAFQLAQLFSLVNQQGSSIGQLSSENEAFKAQSAQNQASVARLTLENVELRKKAGTLEKKVEDQAMVIAELSRVAIPGGHWLWKGGRDQLERLGVEGEVDGRWLWSLEEYKSQPPRPRTGPPPSLDSLPVELIDIVLSLLDRPAHVALCRVSFRLLQLASRRIYGPDLRLGPRLAVSFVRARIIETPPSYDRIRSLLLPRCLILSGNHFNPSPFDLLSSEPDPLNPIPSHCVRIPTPASLFPPDVLEWRPLLRFLNPRTFQCGSVPRPGARPSKVSFFYLPESALSFLTSWTHFTSFQAYGYRSIPMLKERQGTFAFAKHLKRASPDRVVEMTLVRTYRDTAKVERKVLDLMRAVDGLPSYHNPDPGYPNVAFEARAMGS